MLNQRIESGWPGHCQECNRFGIEVRRIAILDFLHDQRRGYALICFCCFGRRVFWTHKNGRKMESPLPQEI